MYDNDFDLSPAAASSTWTVEDIDELNWAETMLRRGGVIVESRLGESDEGHSWCIFCRVESGAVLAHFAKIDGAYIGRLARSRRNYRYAPNH